MVQKKNIINYKIGLVRWCSGVLIFCALVLRCTIFSYASDMAGADFLNIGVGAKAAGMGEAFGAVADDGTASYWNPAGLAQLKRKEISLMHNQWFQNINYQFLSYVHPIELLQAVAGVSVNLVSAGDIQGYAIDGSKSENFDVYNLLSSFSYAQDLSVSFIPGIVRLGTNLKFIDEKLEEEKSQSFAADIGLLYEFSSFHLPFIQSKTLGVPSLKFGFVVQNLGAKEKFVEEEFSLPQNYKVGISLNLSRAEFLLNNLILALDYNKPREEPAYINIGGELKTKWAALRLGYRSKEDLDNGMRYGLGINVDDISFDYAYAPYGELGDSHRFSVGFQFGEVARDREEILTDKKVNKLFKEGEKQFKRGEIYEAGKIFKSALLIKESHKESKEYLNKVIDSLYAAGINLYEDGSNEEAFTKLKEVLDLDQTHQGACKYLPLAKEKWEEQNKQKEKDKKEDKKEKEKAKKRKKEAERYDMDKEMKEFEPKP